MYPPINDSMPEDEKVRLLARQIGELMGGDSKKFRQATTIVLVNRYGGRFSPLRRKVCSYLGSLPKSQGEQLTFLRV